MRITRLPSVVRAANTVAEERGLKNRGEADLISLRPEVFSQVIRLQWSVLLLPCYWKKPGEKLNGRMPAISRRRSRRFCSLAPERKGFRNGNGRKPSHSIRFLEPDSSILPGATRFWFPANMNRGKLCPVADGMSANWRAVTRKSFIFLLKRIGRISPLIFPGTGSWLSINPILVGRRCCSENLSCVFLRLARTESRSSRSAVIL